MQKGFQLIFIGLKNTSRCYDHFNLISYLRSGQTNFKSKLYYYIMLTIAHVHNYTCLYYITKK